MDDDTSRKIAADVAAIRNYAQVIAWILIGCVVGGILLWLLALSST